MKALPIKLVAVLLVSALLVWMRMPGPEDEIPPRQVDREASSPLGIDSSDADEYMVSFIDPGISSQEYEFGEYWDPADPTTFAVIERDFQTGVVQTFTYGASFPLLDADHFKKNLFCVLGRTTNGEYVVEKWKRTAKVGIWGNPAFIMKRSPLFQGLSLGQIRMVGCDPDQRFVILLHGEAPALISQLDLSTKTITPIYTALDSLHIESIDGWTVEQHAVEGRTWLLYDPQLEFVSLMQDHDNDAVFDRLVTYDYDTYRSLYQTPPLLWTDDFFDQEEP